MDHFFWLKAFFLWFPLFSKPWFDFHVNIKVSSIRLVLIFVLYNYIVYIGYRLHALFVDFLSNVLFIGSPEKCIKTQHSWSFPRLFAVLQRNNLYKHDCLLRHFSTKYQSALIDDNWYTFYWTKTATKGVEFDQSRIELVPKDLIRPDSTFEFEIFNLKCQNSNKFEWKRPSLQKWSHNSAFTFY